MDGERIAFQPGLADWLTEHVSSDLTEEDAALLLEKYCANSGMRAPDNRGRTILEGFMRLVQLIRSRELVADEGIQTGAFPLFTFHVPRNGEGSIALKREAETTRQFGLSIFGSGLGGKLSLKLSQSFELAGCKRCQTLFQWINVRIRRYRVRNGDGSFTEEVTVDPVEWLRHEPRERGDCCQSPVSQVSRFHYSILEPQTVDARQTTASIKVVREVAVQFGATLSAKLTCPGGFEIGLELESNGSLACETSWEFQPGRLYLPYVPRSNLTLLPQWAIE